MYLLYVDDSGLVTDTNCRHCVLAGFAIRETKTFYVQRNIDEMVLKELDRADVELHGTHMRTGKGAWRGIPKEKRERLLLSVLDYIAANYPDQFILFGAALAKSANQSVSLNEELFTQITSRFDMLLKRRYAKKKPTKGIAIFDKSTSEQQFQIWSQVFQKTGNHWGGTLANFAEVPLFLDSKMSRLIQLADLIAYSLFRKYEFNDEAYFSKIKDCFDKDTVAGVIHGLYVH
jgi:hypothetical protein